MDPLVPIVALFRLMAEALLIRAYVRVLHIEHWGWFAACEIAADGLLIVLRAVLFPRAPLLLAFAQMLYYLLPFLFSKGNLLKRAFSIAALVVALFVGDISASLLYTHLVDGPIPNQITDFGDPTAVIFAYCVSLCVAASALELVIVLHNKLEKNDDEVLYAPIIAFPLGAVFLLTYVYSGIGTRGGMQMSSIGLVFAQCVLALAIALVLQAIAQRDFENQRAMADEVAAARQGKHLRATVASTARSSAGVRRLRHDLANQVDVGRELAAAGRTQEADRYLAALQEQAHSLGSK